MRLTPRAKEELGNKLICDKLIDLKYFSSILLHHNRYNSFSKTSKTKNFDNYSINDYLDIYYKVDWFWIKKVDNLETKFGIQIKTRFISSKEYYDLLIPYNHQICDSLSDYLIIWNITFSDNIFLLESIYSIKLIDLKEIFSSPISFTPNKERYLAWCKLIDKTINGKKVTFLSIPLSHPIIKVLCNEPYLEAGLNAKNIKNREIDLVRDSWLWRLHYHNINPTNYHSYFYRSTSKGFYLFNDVDKKKRLVDPNESLFIIDIKKITKDITYYNTSNIMKEECKEVLLYNINQKEIYSIIYQKTYLSPELENNLSSLNIWDVYKLTYPSAEQNSLLFKK